MGNNFIELDDSNFEEEVIEKKIPIIVDFYAGWCAPCKKLIPVLESLYEEFNGELKIGKVNIEETSLASKYSVFNLPSILFFDNGEVICRKTGVQSKNSIKEMLVEKIK